jgi:hypothetical protein
MLEGGSWLFNISVSITAYRQGHGCIEKKNTQNFIKKDNILAKELKFTCVVKKIRNEDLNCVQKLYQSTCTLGSRGGGRAAPSPLGYEG